MPPATAGGGLSSLSDGHPGARVPLRMQLTPPGYQTGMVCFETRGGGEAAAQAVTVVNEALQVLLGSAGEDAGRGGVRHRATRGRC